MCESAPSATDDEIATELLIYSETDYGGTLIVEGPEDELFLSFVLPPDLRVIKSSSGKSGVLKVLDESPLGSAVGLIDRDYNGIKHHLRMSNLTSIHFDEVAISDNIVQTRNHDLHTDALLALRSAWLKAIARRIFEKMKPQKTQNLILRQLEKELGSLLDKAIDLAFIVAVIRVISLAGNENWNIRGVAAARWVEVNDEFESFKQALVNASGKTIQDFDECFGPFFESVSTDLEGEKETLIGDHDLIDIFNQLIHKKYGVAPSKGGLMTCLHTAVDHHSAEVSELHFAVELNKCFVALGDSPIFA